MVDGELAAGERDDDQVPPTDQKIKMVKGAVTFLDVLGWKGIWTRVEDATSRLQSLVKSANVAIDQFLSSDDSGEFRGISPRVESISDTLVLFTPGDVRAALFLHGVVCQKLVCDSILKMIPIRGATSYGEYNASDDRIMIGPAIDEAASWHESIDWIGVVQTPGAHFRTMDLDPSGPWVEYESVPAKLGHRFKKLRCVDWPGEWRKQHGGRDELTKQFLEMGPLDPAVALKYYNTLDFFFSTERKPGGVAVGGEKAAAPSHEPLAKSDT